MTLDESRYDQRIERFARRICNGLSLDPDAKIVRGVPEYLGTDAYHSTAFYLPHENNIAPLWTLYRWQAEVMIDIIDDEKSL